MTARRAGTLAVASVVGGRAAGRPAGDLGRLDRPERVLRGDGPDPAGDAHRDRVERERDRGRRPRSRPRPSERSATPSWLRRAGARRSTSRRRRGARRCSCCGWLARGSAAWRVRRLRRRRRAAADERRRSRCSSRRRGSRARSWRTPTTSGAALLEDGRPRNAIVACWHRFEVQAAAGGRRTTRLGDAPRSTRSGCSTSSTPHEPAVSRLARALPRGALLRARLTEADRAARRSTRSTRSTARSAVRA